MLIAITTDERSRFRKPAFAFSNARNVFQSESFFKSLPQAAALTKSSPKAAHGAGPLAAGVESHRAIAVAAAFDDLGQAERVYRNMEVNTGISKKEPSFPCGKRGFK